MKSGSRPTLTTRPLYYLDPGKLLFDARVLRVRGSQVVLDSSCFSPDLRGRAGDNGTIGSARMFGSEITPQDEHVHNLDTTHRVLEGTRVSCLVNSERRQGLMRAHLLQHLIRFAIQSISSCPTYPGHVNARGCAVFVEGYLEELEQIQQWVASVAADNAPIYNWADPSDSRRRFWHVDGIGTAPCLGVHLDSTGRLGSFEIERIVTNSGQVCTLGHLQ